VRLVQGRNQKRLAKQYKKHLGLERRCPGWTQYLLECIKAVPFNSNDASLLLPRVNTRVTYFLKKSVILGCFPVEVDLVRELPKAVELGFRFFVAPLFEVFVLIGTFFIGDLEGALELPVLAFAFCVFDTLGLSGLSSSG